MTEQTFSVYQIPYSRLPHLNLRGPIAPGINNLVVPSLLSNSDGNKSATAIGQFHSLDSEARYDHTFEIQLNLELWFGHNCAPVHDPS
jgi:hypothetical protein